MRPELIGHHGHQRLHGGVVSATLDALGGLAVMAAIGARHMDESIDARMARFGKLGTIDLRVDYPAPGHRPALHGASAEVMRLGSRVASTRMEFFDAAGPAAEHRCGCLHRQLSGPRLSGPRRRREARPPERRHRRLARVAALNRP